MATPVDLLNDILQCAEVNLDAKSVNDENIRARIEYISQCLGNRAGVRLLMACMLAKIDKPQVAPRQPYTEIGSAECFSGRAYDEKYITSFINNNDLPCNSTTAFLTPALRNINQSLTTEVTLVGKPTKIYSDTIQVLDEVANNRVQANDVLTDIVRMLLRIRNEKRARMKSLLEGMKHGEDSLPLSSEAIVTLVKQHLACRHSSRLPVLVVAAAYHAASDKLGESILPLQAHNAADEQTGAIGDVEVCLENEENVVTAYEMKMKRVTVDDIDRAVTKIGNREPRINNYIFVTTDVIDETVRE